MGGELLPRMADCNLQSAACSLHPASCSWHLTFRWAYERLIVITRQCRVEWQILQLDDLKRLARPTECQVLIKVRRNIIIINARARECQADRKTLPADQMKLMPNRAQYPVLVRWTGSVKVGTGHVINFAVHIPHKFKQYQSPLYENCSQPFI